MIQPPVHETLPELADFRLLDQETRHPDPLVRKIVAVWKKNVAITYRTEQVDWRIGEDCYLLVDQTADVLYGPGPWDELDYEPSSRPMLEAVLSETLRLDPAAPDRNKALAVMRFARDLRNTQPEEGELLHGGSEEDVIRKGSAMCNEQSRVMIRLAQIAGLPARYVGHITGDHGCAEIKVDGHWAYFDIRGHHYDRDDGRLASIRDLKSDPGLIERLSPEAAEDIIPGRTRAMTRKHTFPRAITVIAPYRLADVSWRDYGWTFSTKNLRDRLAEHQTRWHAVLDELHGGTDFTQAR
jgi:hypothetical protein